MEVAEGGPFRAGVAPVTEGKADDGAEPAPSGGLFARGKAEAQADPAGTGCSASSAAAAGRSSRGGAPGRVLQVAPPPCLHAFLVLPRTVQHGLEHQPLGTSTT